MLSNCISTLLKSGLFWFKLFRLTLFNNLTPLIPKNYIIFAASINLIISETKTEFNVYSVHAKIISRFHTYLYIGEGNYLKDII